MLKRAMPDILRKQTKITNFCKLFGAAEIKFAWTLGTINDQEFAIWTRSIAGCAARDVCFGKSKRRCPV
jgi:hypothetical protein